MQIQAFIRWFARGDGGHPHIPHQALGAASPMRHVRCDELTHPLKSALNT